MLNLLFPKTQANTNYMLSRTHNKPGCEKIKTSWNMVQNRKESTSKKPPQKTASTVKRTLNIFLIKIMCKNNFFLPVYRKPFVSWSLTNSLRCTLSPLSPCLMFFCFLFPSLCFPSPLSFLVEHDNIFLVFS